MEDTLAVDGLEKTWQAIGIDPAKLERDGRGTIQPTTTLPPMDLFGPRTSFTLPRIAVEGVDKVIPDLRFGSTLGEGGSSVVKQATQLPLGARSPSRSSATTVPRGSPPWSCSAKH